MESKRKIGILYYISDFVEYFKDRLPPQFELKLIQIGPVTGEIKHWDYKPPDEVFHRVVKELNACEIVIGYSLFVGPYLYHVTNVKWFFSLSAGVDFCMNRLIPGKTPSFMLTRFGGFYGRQISEYVISNIICSERRYTYYNDMQKQKLWANFPVLKNYMTPYRMVSTLSICILGLGDIGSEVAKQCKNFDMTVYGMVTKVPEHKEDFVDGYFTSEELSTYLKKADYVCNCLPKTPLTDDILTHGVLKNCSERKAVFINVGRGNVIKNRAIIEAVQNEWIKGAVLDVFEEEPLPADSPLWNLPGVIVTPHISGTTLISEASNHFYKNLDLYEKGEELHYVVDWNKHY